MDNSPTGSGLIHSLFGRLFATLVTVVMVFSAAVYLLSVPLARETMQDSEEVAGRTILDTVHQIVKRSKSDLDNFREATIQARRKELKDVIQLMESNLRNRLDRRLAAGESREKILPEIFEEFRAFLFGDQDYIWVMDYDFLILSHPDPRLHGKRFPGLKDVKGNPVLAPLVEVGRREGEGFHNYWWRRLGQETPSEKLSYCKDLADLGFLICSGVYLDDVAATVEERQRELFADLSRELKEIRLAKGGYVFVFDNDFNMLIHPNANLEGKSLRHKIDPLTGEPLAGRLKKVADQPQGLRYRWDRPDDPGNYSYDKLAWVRHFEGFDWYLATSVYLDDLYAGSVQLARRLFWIALGGLILAMVLGYLFVRRMTEPLELLSATAQKVEKGDLTARCPLARQDEIGVVANAFNAMVGELQEHIGHLDDKVRTRTRELERANDELREMDRLKSEFLSSVSHELRTPLTSILGFAKLLRRRLEKMAPPLEEGTARREWGKAQENLTAIMDEGERLTRLIDQVMELTTLEAGQITMHMAPLEMTGMLEAVVASLRPRAEAAGLTLELEMPGELPFPVGDEKRLRQVVAQLLDNALKFTPRGRILVRATREDPWLEVSVTDSGPGVPEGLREKIFNRFHQVGEVLLEKPEGLGLGLSISRLIVERHGGVIGMEPTAAGGSRFFFRLRLPDTPVGA